MNDCTDKTCFKMKSIYSVVPVFNFFVFEAHLAVLLFGATSNQCPGDHVVPQIESRPPTCKTHKLAL